MVEPPNEMMMVEFAREVVALPSEMVGARSEVDGFARGTHDSIREVAGFVREVLESPCEMVRLDREILGFARGMVEPLSRPVRWMKDWMVGECTIAFSIERSMSSAPLFTFS